MLRHRTVEDLVDLRLEPRLNQIFVPLLSVIRDPKAREDLRDLALGYQRNLVADRGLDTEAQVLEVIRDVLASGDLRLSVQDIARWFADRHGEDYQRKVTAKWVGWVLRRKLRLRTRRIHGVYVIPTEELPRVKWLFEKYGIGAPDTESPEVSGGNPGTDPVVPAEVDFG